MVESVTVDLEGMEIGDSVGLADLDIAKNDTIELLIEADSQLTSSSREPQKHPMRMRKAISARSCNGGEGG